MSSRHPLSSVAWNVAFVSEACDISILVWSHGEHHGISPPASWEGRENLRSLHAPGSPVWPLSKDIHIFLLGFSQLLFLDWTDGRQESREREGGRCAGNGLSRIRTQAPSGPFYLCTVVTEAHKPVYIIAPNPKLVVILYERMFTGKMETDWLIPFSFFWNDSLSAWSGCNEIKNRDVLLVT